MPSVSVSEGKAKGTWTGKTSDVGVTDGQKLKMEQIQRRDEEFDRQLEDIGEGIQDLTEIAQMQGEEVRRQNAALETIGNKVDKVQEHMSSVNSRLKNTLTDVGRKADKLCVDIICIVLIIGFAAVVYNMFKNSSSK